MGVLSVRMYLHHRHALPHETGIIGGCEPLHGSWELNLGPLQGQLMLLAAEPVFQPRFLVSVLKN